MLLAAAAAAGQWCDGRGAVAGGGVRGAGAHRHGAYHEVPPPAAERPPNAPQGAPRSNCAPHHVLVPNGTAIILSVAVIDC